MIKNNNITQLPKTLAEFHENFVIDKKLGQGAFSVVHRCTRRKDAMIFAVKIVNVRPLRLRQQFDITRLHREVDIMSRINHPGIIKLYEVFEDSDTMMLVMEYADGVDLFDSILKEKSYSEAKARPIFQQLATALAYLHSNSIVHRDVKPENVLIINHTPVAGSTTSETVVKLLDFGLSKVVDERFGSTAKSFVGTPCYLAPEVELLRNRPEGATYGVEVDCWSLGAVLYVMLIARFPEFDRTTGVPLVKLEGALWSHVSDDAKQLIKGLMNPNISQRLSAMDALQSHWLRTKPMSFEKYDSQRITRNPTVSLSGSPEGMSPRDLDDDVRSGGSPRVRQRREASQQSHQSDASSTADLDFYNGVISVRAAEQKEMSAPKETSPFPVIGLHKRVGEIFKVALQSSSALGPKLRSAALMGRNQLKDTLKTLRKLDELARQVALGVQDVVLAIEAGEPTLAHKFLDQQRTWVQDLRREVAEIQKSNQDLMGEINRIIGELPYVEKSIMPAAEVSDVEKSIDVSSSDVYPPPAPREASTTQTSDNSSRGYRSDKLAPALAIDDDLLRKLKANTSDEKLTEDELMSLMLPKLAHNGTGSNYAVLTDQMTTTKDTQKALPQIRLLLEEVDMELERLSSLWANIELAFDMMLMKSDHLNHFIDYARNPRVMDRFRARMDDYEYFWNAMQRLTSSNIGKDESRHPQQTALKEQTDYLRICARTNTP